MTTVRFLIAGRVQGVGFRWWARRTAEGLGIGGWARNLPDGRVEVLAQGPGEAIDQLAKALKSGPRLSRVENVERHDDPHHTNTYKSFDTM